MLLLTGMALAAPPTPWVSEWYGQPRGNIRAISVNGVTTAQATLGAEGGVRYNHAPITKKRVKGQKKRKLVRGQPDVVGRTRLRGDVLYGLIAGSFGYDVRLGSFLGPTSKYVTYQIGPDFFGNGYGTSESADYYLPFSLGIEVQNAVIFHIDRSITAQVGVTPGWVFDKDRQTGGVGPIHELTGIATVSFQTGAFSLTVGYQRVYNAAGVTDGLILSGSL